MSGGRVDLTLRCPTCGQPADVCFDHGYVWKQPGLLEREPTVIHRMTVHELRARVNEFTEDDPPPYGEPVCAWCEMHNVCDPANCPHRSSESLDLPPASTPATALPSLQDPGRAGKVGAG